MKMQKSFLFLSLLFVSREVACRGGGRAGGGRFGGRGRAGHLVGEEAVHQDLEVNLVGFHQIKEKLSRVQSLTRDSGGIPSVM